MPVRIGELLLKEKRINPTQLQEALTYQKSNGGKLGFNLVKLGFVKDEEITALLSKQYGVPSINLAQFDIDVGVVKLIPADTAQKYQIVPLSRSGATLTIAMTDPTNVFAMDDIKPGFPFCLPRMAPYTPEGPPSARNSCRRTFVQLQRPSPQPALTCDRLAPLLSGHFSDTAPHVCRFFARRASLHSARASACRRR